ncbi:MAG: SDR family oxidoreductase [Bacteroidota bacterium]
MPDRIAIITGAGKGIGKAIAERLSADGFYVALVDVDQAAMEEAVAIIGADKATGYLVDITNENQVKALFENIENAKNKIDLLVNNAGIIRDNLIWNLSANDFDAVINVNLKGTWLMCREAAIRMKQQKYGCIVNIASRAWLGNAGQTNYSASKAGIIGLTRSLALEMGRHNVSVNAIAPGLIDTPLTQKLDKDVLDKLIQAQPSRSMGKPEDIANVFHFLLQKKQVS